MPASWFPIEEFKPPSDTYPGTIAEVKIGATRKEGGTRGRCVVVGGGRAPPFFRFESPPTNPPVVASAIFDIPIQLPQTLRACFGEVIDDPVDWARKWVKDFKSEVLMVNLVSTDPKKEDRTPAEAAKIVENLLQTVDVPLILGGSRNVEKDPLVLAKVAEVSEGERCVLSAAAIEMDHKRVAQAAKSHGHVVVAYSDLDFVMQKTINQHLLAVGLSKEQILMDPTTAPLGYGLEYSFSIMERLRLAGLKGDTDLQVPIIAMVFNAWAAPGAWEEAKPLWEITTGITALLAGADLLVVLHPETAQKLRALIAELAGEVKTREETGAL